jgi:hypothetical protein
MPHWNFHYNFLATSINVRTSIGVGTSIKSYIVGTTIYEDLAFRHIKVMSIIIVEVTNKLLFEVIKFDDLRHGNIYQNIMKCI